ncbi:hypothetical protein WJX84_004688 [Apatococcus fuscideae]|uniref:Uncharacterized protein n=1 Tax=Apatococcus fuscideae TaxID=2026836 RepID=A0AAW1SIU4_9CHLO
MLCTHRRRADALKDHDSVACGTVLLGNGPAGPQGHGLIRVTAYASCICPFPLQATWEVLRNWGSLSWLPQLFGRRILLTQGKDASIRHIASGKACIVERLLRADDQQYMLKWQMISGTAEVQTSLAASLVDYVATVQLLPVSVGNQTYCAWSGEFMTEAHMACQYRTQPNPPAKGWSVASDWFRSECMIVQLPVQV